MSDPRQDLLMYFRVLEQAVSSLESENTTLRESLRVLLPEFPAEFERQSKQPESPHSEQPPDKALKGPDRAEQLVQSMEALFRR